MKEDNKQDVNELERADNEIVRPPVVTTQVQQKKPIATGAVIAVVAAVAIVTGIGGFVGGMQFQKGAASSAVANQRGMGGMGGPGSMAMDQNGAFGEVTAISGSSITVATRQRFNQNNNASTNTTKTFTINDSTKITVDSKEGSAGDIKVGDHVMIGADDSDSSTADSIRIGSGPQDSQQSSNGTNVPTRTN